MKVEISTPPLGIRNNNPGNLRFLAKNPFNGQVGENKGFGVYDSMENGIRAAAKQIKKHIRTGASSIELLITRWAPPTENNTSAYIDTVAKKLNRGQHDLLNADDPDLIFRLCQAIFFHENGVEIPVHQIEEGVRRAFEG